MLGHRLRRCPNINPALAEYIALAGSARLNKYEIFICRWLNAGNRLRR